MTHSRHHSPIKNRLLAALPRSDYQRLLPSFEAVTLDFGDVIYEPGDAIKHIYFPDDSLVSLLTLANGHLALEVGMVGCEGLVGAAYALGAGVTPVRALVQGSGSAMRMKAPAFRREFLGCPPLQRLVHRYIHALMGQIAQTAACNRFHVIEERLARWLLMTRDRVGSDHFRLTHDFLGHMLGVRRVGVTNAASALRQQGLIDYRRGGISILDGPGLEGASCACYAVVRNE